MTNRPLHERTSILPPQITAPLKLPKKASQSPTASSFLSAQPPHQAEPTSSPTKPPVISSPTSALAVDADKDLSTCISPAHFDVEAGMGPTMLQSLVGDGVDDDSHDWSQESGYGTMVSHPSHESTTGANVPSNTRHSSSSQTPSTPNKDREICRPSLAPSATSLDSREGEIYDDYRYSMATKTSRYSSTANLASAAAAAASSNERSYHCLHCPHLIPIPETAVIQDQTLSRIFGRVLPPKSY
jgi:hypothetical protein